MQNKKFDQENVYLYFGNFYKKTFLRISSAELSLCKTPCTQTIYDVRPTQMNNRTIIEINFDFDLEADDFLPTLFNLVFRLTLPGSSLASQSGMSSQAWVGR